MALRLTDSEVQQVLNVFELVDAMEAAMVEFAEGKVVQPVRTVFDFGDGRLFGSMPAYVPRVSVHGAKMLTVLPERGRMGLPTHVSTIVLLDPATGELEAVVDANFLTAVRTAAVSAVSIRHLASINSTVLAIIGSGTQARSHTSLLSTVFDFDDIRAWSPNSAHLAQFVEQSGGRVRSAVSAADAVQDADIILLATSSQTPVIALEWIKSGAHIISLGACRPNHREIDPKLLATSYLVVDSKQAAVREAGDIVQAIKNRIFTESHIRSELGMIAHHEQRRNAPSMISVFKSLGMAVEDLVAAHLSVESARTQGVGREI